jgi:hypothetical protein
MKSAVEIKTLKIKNPGERPRGRFRRNPMLTTYPGRVGRDDPKSFHTLRFNQKPESIQDDLLHLLLYVNKCNALLAKSQ